MVRKGPLPQFSHALEGHLRERLKFPVRLNEGTVDLLQEKDLKIQFSIIFALWKKVFESLIQDVFLAKDGVRITPDQSRLLKLFGRSIYLF